MALDRWSARLKWAVYHRKLLEPLTEVTVATKIDSAELKQIDAIIRRRGLLNRGDLVREAIRLYLSLSSLETEALLRMLRLIDESVGVSGKTAGQLVEEAWREEDARPLRGGRVVGKDAYREILKELDSLRKKWS